MIEPEPYRLRAIGAPPLDELECTDTNTLSQIVSHQAEALLRWCLQIEESYQIRIQTDGLVGRAGVEPAQLSRRFYSSPRCILCRR